nr:hypothetical protein [Tanacetum cinerariifolium]
MAPYEAFACRCGKGDVLRESYQPYTRGKLYYACPRSKPKENDYGCKKFWNEERVRLLLSSSGSSSTTSYSSEASSPNSYSSGNSNLYQLSKMDASFNNENEAWKYSLDIDDFDLHLTPVVRSSNSSHVKPSPYTTNPITIIPGPSGVVHVSSSPRVEPSTSNLNPVRIIPGPAGLVQKAKLFKEKGFILDPDGALMSTQQYMGKAVEDVGDDDDFKSAA